MHIQKVHLENIRSFENLEIDFGDSGAGWHVILGTNGTGKSTLIRSIALALVGAREAQPLVFRYSWKYWIRVGAERGLINLDIENNPNKTAYSLQFLRDEMSTPFLQINPFIPSSEKIPFFSAAYGTFRRVTGGSPDYKNIWENAPKLAAHLSVFGEDIALDQSIEWLEDLSHNNTKVAIIYDNKKNELLSNAPDIIKNFINNSQLLPNGITMELSPFWGIRFTNKDNIELPITELSDGYRSILSLTLELLRQLCRFYSDDVTKVFSKDQNYITTKGVVLIDEIDAHLHPTWQAKIGEWFTKHFPNIQFIVTTHSPIICRSASSGTIWKLSNEGKSTQIKKIDGIERQQLLYGNILDAFETDIFGEDISRSQQSKEMLKELAILNVKKQVGRISGEEITRLEELQQIFQTDVKDNFLDD